MAHRIILLSDGTGNAASKVWRTNVWRVYEFLDLSGSDQVAKYDDGVGSSSFKPLALLGGAFGWGLKRNVIDLYKFVCRNYRPPAPGTSEAVGSQIYGFGFSRGAFTIRILMGLILTQGLVPYHSEADLHARARDAYRALRAHSFHSVLRVEWLLRKLRDLFFLFLGKLTGRKPYDKSENIVVPAIEFVGIWDTVAAYGLPIEEMTRGFSQWIWPLELPERILNPKVKRACHALALDDERTTFHPVLWTEQGEKRPAPDDEGTVWLKDERISQVWFSGSHSNVGGGYPDDSLAYFPLLWIMEEARSCGLCFKTHPADPDAFRRVLSSRDADGRQYDSRAGIAAYYRYGPRKIVDHCHLTFSRTPGDSVSIEVPSIHESALVRLRNAGNAYAPIGLPSTYSVATFDGRLLPMDKNPYETPYEAKVRAGDPATKQVGQQEQVWNFVWFRRIIYFMTLAASVHLGAFWLFHDHDPQREHSSSIRMVSESVRLVESFLPKNVVHWWTDYYATNPNSFLIGVITLGLLVYAGSKLGSHISDAMRVIWLKRASAGTMHLSPLHMAIYYFRTHWIYQSALQTAKRHVLPFFSAIFLLWLAVTASSHTLFNAADSAGAYCSETQDSNLKKLKKKGEKSAGQIIFTASDLCFPTGVYVTHGAKYAVSIIEQSDSPWMDLNLPYQTHPNGYRISALPSLWMKLRQLSVLPLRRVLFRRWFSVIARIGSHGVYEDFLDPELDKVETVDGVTRFVYGGTTQRVPRDGEVFLYVNQATIGLPWIDNFFYSKNRGKANIVITHL